MRLGAVIVIIAAVMAAPAAQCADIAGARAFLVRLYAHYPERDKASAFDPIGKSAPQVFDAPMVALLRTSAAQTPKGDEGPVDWDPICSCQDDADMKSEIASLTASGPTTATAVIRLRFRDEKEQLELALSAADGGWRIHDIKSKNVPSLRAYLIQANREAAKRR